MSNIPMKNKIIDDKAEEEESITSKHFNRQSHLAKDLSQSFQNKYFKVKEQHDMVILRGYNKGEMGKFLFEKGNLVYLQLDLYSPVETPFRKEDVAKIKDTSKSICGF